MLLLGEGREQTREVVDETGNRVEKVVRKGMAPAAAEEEMKRLIGCRDVALGRVVRYRIRYFTDGAVLGQSEIRGWDIQRVPGAVRGAAQGWHACAAGCRGTGQGRAVERAGSASAGGIAAQRTTAGRLERRRCRWS